MASTAANSLAGFLFLALVPVIWGSFTAYELGLYLLYGIVGQGIALCWGRTGFLPLGQALFFGIGAYISGASLIAFGNSWLLLPLLLVAILVPAMLAGGVGILVFSRRIGSGPYFSIITLALAMLGFQLANSMVEITGGFNGMTGIPGLPGIDGFSHLYFVVLGALAVSTLALAYVLRAPFGQLLAATSQNEERLQFFGFRTSQLKAAAFAMSAGLAGLAGALYAPHQGIVTPQAVGFLLSAELVIWTAVGGRFSLFGPVIGATLVGFLASGLRNDFAYWEILIALVFVVVVVRWPAGLVGILDSIGPIRRFIRMGRFAVLRGTDIQPRVRGSDPLIEFESVSVSVGTVQILRDLDFQIDIRGIHCLIGPNGAGKTSALNVLTGKLPLASGDVRWMGRSVANKPIFRIAAMGVGRKLQAPSVFPSLSIGQNIDIALWANRIRPVQQLAMSPYQWRTRMLGLLEARFPFLRETNVQTGTLSLGQRQMLDFALTLLAEPSLILLDEPCAGLSVDETVEMIAAIDAMISELSAVAILVEHDMQVVERLSSRVMVLHQGRLLANGPIEEIRRNPNVREVYAGGQKA